MTLRVRAVEIATSLQGRCTCATMDAGVECPWCQVYYGMLRQLSAHEFPKPTPLKNPDARPEGSTRGASMKRRAPVSGAPGRRALFLEFGGTLVHVENGRAVVDAAGNPILNPKVPGTLARVRRAFDGCFIVSNQAQIGKGEITEAEVLRRFAWLNERLGCPFTDWRFCPHQEEEACECRKPRPGMFLDLARVHGLDLSASTHVGDSETDREAAAAAGIGTFVWAGEFFTCSSA